MLVEERGLWREKGRNGQDGTWVSVIPSLLVPTLWADGAGPTVGWAEARGSSPLCFSECGSRELASMHRGEGRRRVNGLQLDWCPVTFRLILQRSQGLPSPEAASSTRHGSLSQAWGPNPPQQPQSLVSTPTASLGAPTWSKLNWLLGRRMARLYKWMFVRCGFPLDLKMSRCPETIPHIFPSPPSHQSWGEPLYAPPAPACPPITAPLTLLARFHGCLPSLTVHPVRTGAVLELTQHPVEWTSGWSGQGWHPLPLPNSTQVPSKDFSSSLDSVW